MAERRPCAELWEAPVWPRGAEGAGSEVESAGTHGTLGGCAQSRGVALGQETGARPGVCSGRWASQGERQAEQSQEGLAAAGETREGPWGLLPAGGQGRTGQQSPQWKQNGVRRACCPPLLHPTPAAPEQTRPGGSLRRRGCCLLPRSQRPMPSHLLKPQAPAPRSWEPWGLHSPCPAPRASCTPGLGPPQASVSPAHHSCATTSFFKVFFKKTTVTKIFIHLCICLLWTVLAVGGLDVFTPYSVTWVWCEGGASASLVLGKRSASEPQPSHILAPWGRFSLLSKGDSRGFPGLEPPPLGGPPAERAPLPGRAVVPPASYLGKRQGGGMTCPGRGPTELWPPALMGTPLGSPVTAECPHG